MKKLLSLLLLFTLLLPGAVDFDATDDLLTCGSEDWVPFGSSGFSMSAWVRIDGVGEGNEGRILDKAHVTLDGYSIQVRNTTSCCTIIAFFFMGGTSAYSVRETNGGTVTVGGSDYQNIIVTSDLSLTDTNIHIYINGSEPGYQTSTNTGSGTWGGEVGVTGYIGNEAGTAGTFDGRIACVAVWNNILTATDIANISGYPGCRKALEASIGAPVRYFDLAQYAEGTTISGTTPFRPFGGGNSCTGSNGPTSQGQLVRVR